MMSLLLLVLFPSAIVGWKWESWGFQNGWDNCATVCNQYKSGWTCSQSDRATFWCSCWGCGHDCSFAADMSLPSKCDIPDIPAVKADVAGKVLGIVADVAIGAISIADPFAGLALAFEKEMFDAASADNSMENKIIADINKRNGQLIECMAEKIDIQASKEQVDEMQQALIAYGTAEMTDESKIEEKAQATFYAWERFREVIGAKFDNKHDAAIFYKKLLIPLQNFAALYSLLSVDYMAYLKVKSDKDFEDRLRATLSSMKILIDWTHDAQAVIKKAFVAKLDGLPCNNGDAMFAQLDTWVSQFHEANTHPIVQYYNALAQMSDSTGSLQPVYLSHSGVECGKQEKNLGVYFKNANECADAAMADDKCTGGSIMWAEGYTWSWGCRCCTPNSGYINSKNWAVYLYDPNGDGVELFSLSGLDYADTDALKSEGSVCEFDATGSGDDAMQIEVLEAEDRYFYFDSSQLDEDHARRGEVMMVRNDRTGSMVNVMIWKNGHARKHPRRLAKKGDWNVGDILTVVGDNCAEGLRCLATVNDGEFTCQSRGGKDGRVRLLSA